MFGPSDFSPIPVIEMSLCGHARRCTAEPIPGDSDKNSRHSRAYIPSWPNGRYLTKIVMGVIVLARFVSNAFQALAPIGLSGKTHGGNRLALRDTSSVGMAQPDPASPLRCHCFGRS